MEQIKPITTKKVPKIYEHTTEQVDNITGEVLSNTRTFVKEVNTRDEFIKLYATNMDYVNKNLTDMEIRILLHALNNVNYKNNFRFDGNFVGFFVENEIMKKTTVYRHFKSLVEKSVFIKATPDLKKAYNIYGDNVYFVHPDVASKGPFNELLELKRTIVQTFDFEKYTMKQEVTTEAKYNGFNEIAQNLDKHEVKQINQIVSNDGKHNEMEIVIGEKEDYIEKSNVVIDIEPNEVITPQPKEHNDEPNLFSGIDLEEDKQNEPNLNDSKAYDIQMMIERRKFIEAENEKQKLENENLKLQIELKKLDLQNK